MPDMITTYSSIRNIRFTRSFSSYDINPMREPMKGMSKRKTNIGVSNVNSFLAMLPKRSVAAGMTFAIMYIIANDATIATCHHVSRPELPIGITYSVMVAPPYSLYIYNPGRAQLLLQQSPLRHS